MSASTHPQESLRDHHALVTGAGSGIGLATARELASRGARITIHDIDRGSAERSAKQLEELFGVDTCAVVGDVCKEREVSHAFARSAKVLGPITILVNNAGIMPPKVDVAHRIPVADFDRMLAVHLRGAFLASREVITNMRRRHFGRIVNVSSVLGLVGLPFRVAYQVAKTGILGLTRTLALENARYGITVNAIAPGYIFTEALRARADKGLISYDLYADRTPVGRWGTPEEVARVVRFLAAPESSFITGAIYAVDGGYTVRGDPGEDIGKREEGYSARAGAKRGARGRGHATAPPTQMRIRKR